jgi:hypothetical protein
MTNVEVESESFHIFMGSDLDLKAACLLSSVLVLVTTFACLIELWYLNKIY